MLFRSTGSSRLKRGVGTAQDPGPDRVLPARASGTQSRQPRGASIIPIRFHGLEGRSRKRPGPRRDRPSHGHSWEECSCSHSTSAFGRRTWNLGSMPRNVAGFAHRRRVALPSAHEKTAPPPRPRLRTPTTAGQGRQATLHSGSSALHPCSSALHPCSSGLHS